MERDELEVQSREILSRAASTIAEMLTVLEETPEDYLAAINSVSDSMIQTTKKALNSEAAKPQTSDEKDEETVSGNQPKVSIVKVPIYQFEREYAANPIKARRQYTGKIVHVHADMEQFAEYLEHGAGSSATCSPEEKYKYKNVFMVIPGEVCYINEINKDGMIYDVRVRGKTETGKDWEIISLLPKEAGKQVMSISKGQTIKVIGRYNGRKDNVYDFRDSELISSEGKDTSSLWKYVLGLAFIGAAIYYFFMK